jgi:CheY-like chemotaxis protein
VLLVEDNPINRKLAERMLVRLGCTVQVATNGEEAVAAVCEQRFDLIMMDVQMPILDGYQATGEIRALEAASGIHTPIVAVTANAMERDAQRCLAAGMDDHLAKPMRLGDLSRMVRRWLPAIAES